jgi:spore germination protein GerM
MTPRQVNLLTALGLIALLAVVTLTAPRWSRFLRQPLAAAPEDDGASEGAEAGASTARAMEPEGERRISVRLYFESADQGGGLVPEERSVPLAGDLARQIQTVMTELVRGSTTGLLPTLPPEAHVLEAFVSARGIAYIDFSPEIRQAALGGSQAELVAVYSIVNSVAANFPAVKKVQILVEDKPVTTLSGHVDLSRPLGPDMTFLALPSPSPSASAGAVPTP